MSDSVSASQHEYYIMLWLRISSQCRRKELCNFFPYLYEYCGLNGVDILYCTHA